jgi:hypothetical protein
MFHTNLFCEYKLQGRHFRDHPVSSELLMVQV